MDRNCSGRLHLTREILAGGKILYKSPEVTKECIKYSAHSWVKKQKFSEDLSKNSLKEADLGRKSIQLLYFEKELGEKGNSENVDLIKKFTKENPNTNLSIQSRDITILKQNLKRRALDNRKVIDRIDAILNSKGQPFLVEKVNLIKLQTFLTIKKI